MASRPLRKCAEKNCTEVGSWLNGRCSQHQALPVQRRKERHGFFDARWERFRQLLMGLGNVICQRVDVDGRRCKNPVYFFHHILETWQHPTLALDWRNVVGVCASCHPRPWDRDQGHYVPTLYRDLGSDQPLPEPTHLPGSVVSKDAEVWDVENRRNVLLAGEKSHTGYQGQIYSRAS